MSDTVFDYKSTVFLPRTAFPMRAELPKREPELLRRWAEVGLWEKLRAAAKGRPSFILHDGPPYANGNLHIGHALNKIHKDVLNRAQAMAGRDANYIPGWDCHGLPIEWKIEEAYRKAGKDKDEVPILEFRRECREYAQRWLDIQSAEFQRLGVAGDWANRYATMDFTSEAAIAAEIGKFLLNGALYRGLRPVMWSPVEKTALAEAEVEYHDKKDTAIYVRFPFAGGGAAAGNGPAAGPAPADFADAAIAIWTTTPWTIPGNRGLAVGEAFDYLLLRVTEIAEGSLAREGEKLIVAEALLEDFCAKTGIAGYETLRRFKGAELDGRHFRHPLASQDPGFDFTVPVMLGEFVTTEAGTGIVHMSPGHGEDDFFLCRAHGIAVPDTVQADGTYYPSMPLFAGVHVYKAAEPVCAALIAAGALLHREEFLHSYPHSWRSKAPLIYRATPNWFIRMDGPEQLRETALAAIDATQFVPAIGRNRIRAMVESRPDWCVSRQRAWGVPIAIFVHKTTHEPLRDPAVMQRVVEIFATEGADAWYARPAQDFLGNDHRAEEYEQVFDIVDVWFESGSTHAFVLEARGLPSPADVYLEGSDQHRGWFQASLLESVGTRGVAPFKAVVTDGFVLDEQGRKMSKSLGNVTAPQEVTDKYGADILRLWVMNSDTSEDLRIGPEILKQQAELYRRLRNTLRWLLGSLDGFTEAERVPEQEFPELERLILHRLAELNAMLQNALATHDWTAVYPAIHHFCATDLSAFYFDIRKDSLYCDRPDAATRRACRSLLDILHRCLVAWLAPVLPFTAEEAYQTRFGEDASVHLTLFPDVPETWRDDALAARWAEIREHRAGVTGAIEAMRREKEIGASLQAVAVVSPEARALLPELATWAELCITSGAVPGVANTAALAPGEKCERCWRVLPEVGEDPAHPTLCRRCCEAVA
ncbi:MAG: isoleucine--tRNA ligase [Rhodospirillales bacterium 20-64-7]|nr:MAG: isoleucine--tRNA ligase [Rhodospirillales bacterium 20-64-7]